MVIESDCLLAQDRRRVMVFSFDRDVNRKDDEAEFHPFKTVRNSWHLITQIVGHLHYLFSETLLLLIGERDGCL